jgi:broad specificity phosphatase PhoE
MNKSNAEELYPELFALVKDGYVPGAETEEGFLERVEKLLNNITESNKTLICVTHGGVLSRLLKNYFNKEIEKAGDGCFILIDLDDKTIEETDGVKFKQ